MLSECCNMTKYETVNTEEISIITFLHYATNLDFPLFLRNLINENLLLSIFHRISYEINCEGKHKQVMKKNTILNERNRYVTKQVL